MAVEAKLEELGKVLSRLEQSLDRIEGKIASGPSSSGGSSGAEKPFVAEWDRLVESTITPYLEVSKKLGGDIEQHSQIVSKAIKATRDLLVFASSNKSTPSALEPLSKAIGELKEFKDKNFKTKNPHHLATIAEGASAFAWVAEKLPAPFVGEMRGSSEFWSNRILKDFKGVDETQCSWVKHWNQFLKDLQVYVKNYHTTGLAWA